MPAIEVDKQPWTAEYVRRAEGREPIERIAADLFAPGGPVQRCGLDPRPGQRALAELVGRSADAGWRAAEAPCGSGKGLAYLLPGLVAVRRARKHYAPPPSGKPRLPRLVVSTANQALQAQLVNKDVGIAASVLGWSVSVAPMVGRSNYVCPLRLAESRMVGALTLPPDALAEVRRVGDWFDLDRIPAGHKDGLPGPVSSLAWSRVSTDSESCAGDGCPHHEPSEGFCACPAELARAEAARAEVVVANHAWLARGFAGLGPVALLAIDEAHAFEDALRGSGERRFGRGTPGRLSRLASDAMGRPDAESAVAVPIRRLLAAARAMLDASGASRPGERRPLRPGWASAAGFRDASALRSVEEAAMKVELSGISTSDPVESKRIKHAAEQIRAAHARLVALLDAGPSPDDLGSCPGRWAAWAEVDGDSAAIACAPADVAPLVAAIAKAIPRAVLTSATLCATGDARAFEVGLGFEAVRAEPTVRFPSPWSLPSMGVLVVPPGPGPKEPGWRAWADARTVDAVRAARGRTLVLCSSWSGAKSAATALRAAGLPYAVLAQGDEGREVLARRFRDETDSVLVATRSFFEGLDVRGESCSCVVIDRLPFDAPGDPLEDAAGEVAASRLGGGSPFVARSLPRACAILAQAAGRLLRSATDRGAVVLLDGRSAERSAIGAGARAALPPFPLSRDLGDVARMLDGAPLRLTVPGFVEPAASVAAPPTSIPLRRGRAAS